MRDLLFRDRFEAGRLLGAALRLRYGPSPEALVLALPRGGVPVGVEVAEALEAPLDVFVVRKLGVPGQEELARGAIASGGLRVRNNDVIRDASISAQVIDRVAMVEQRELARREMSYRGSKAPLDVTGRRIFIVDDGLATGATMRRSAGAPQQEPTGSDRGCSCGGE